MMVRCRNNNGIGDCPYRRFCLAALNDRTIIGCNLPFVWQGMISTADAMVWHAVKEDDRK